MHIAKALFITVAIATTGLFWYLNRKERTMRQQSKNADDNPDAEEIVERLDELGYFKYADEADKDALKKNFIHNFDPKADLPTILDDETLLPKDYRNYYCDGETVFESDGISGMLNDLKPLFNKMNFNCVVSNHIEEWDNKNNWLNQSITMNGTEYIIFKNFKGYGWGEAPLKLAQILNTELKKQNKDERIYLVNGGNDGKLTVLNEAQYQYIYSILKDRNWKPLELKEWAELNKIKFTELN